MVTGIKKIVVKNMINKIAGLFIFQFILISAQAQNPVLKVDLDKPDRHEAEVNEPGYAPWRLDSGTADSLILKGIKIKFSGAFSSGWYKAGIQSPYYARLVND